MPLNEFPPDRFPANQGNNPSGKIPFIIHNSSPGQAEGRLFIISRCVFVQFIFMESYPNEPKKAIVNFLFIIPSRICQ